jgi:hypothetical protein
MPDASGRIRGISLSGKAGETLDRIRGFDMSVETTAGGDGRGFASGHRFYEMGGRWQWSAYGPGGAETGTADSKGEAQQRAEDAERRLRKASPRG